MSKQTEQQKAFANADYEVVKATLSKLSQKVHGENIFTFEEFEYPFAPVDFRFWEENQPSWIRVCEVKGRKIKTTQYNDILIDKAKADYVVEEAKRMNNYSSRYNCKGFIYWVYYGDKKIVMMNAETFVNIANVITKKCQADMNDPFNKIEKYMYQYKIYNEDGTCAEGVTVLPFPDSPDWN